jgi:hypothetical protein
MPTILRNCVLCYLCNGFFFGSGVSSVSLPPRINLSDLTSSRSIPTSLSRAFALESASFLSSSISSNKFLRSFSKLLIFSATLLKLLIKLSPFFSRSINGRNRTFKASCTTNKNSELDVKQKLERNATGRRDYLHPMISCSLYPNLLQVSLRIEPFPPHLGS